MPEQPSKANIISVSYVTSRVLIALLSFSVLLLCLDLFVTHADSLMTPIRHIFRVTAEACVGNWFSSVLTFNTGLVLWFICLRTYMDAGSKKRVLVWGTLASMLCYLSADDGAKIHERVGSSIADWWAMENATNTGFFSNAMSTAFEVFPSYPWQLVFVPILGFVGGLLMYVILYEMHDRWSRKLLVIGLSCFCVAIGLDFLEGVPTYGDIPVLSFFSEEDPLMRHYGKAAEETIEMLGMSCLFTSFLHHLLVTYPDWHWTFKK